MCLSLVGQIIFGAVMVAALALTAASMFTPGWQALANETDTVTEDLKHFKVPKQFGIFGFLCRAPTDSNNTFIDADNNSFEFCKKWFSNLPTWEKVVVASMILALIAEMITIVWTVISLFGCCLKATCMGLFPILSLIVAVFLAVAVTVFATNNENVIISLNVTSIDDVTNEVKDALQTKNGYSFYLACGALGAAIIDIFVGWLSLFLAKFCC